MPGDPSATRRLREILAVGAPAPSEDALAVIAVTATTDLGPAVATLERRRRSGAGALAIIVGSEGERADIERRLLSGHRLEASNLVHALSLEGPGGELALEAVIRALGDGAVAAARRNPALRPAVARGLVRTSARQSAAIGALPLPGVDMPALALIQVRLVAQLAALHDRPFGAERALDALAVVGAGFGWRALARSATGLVPVAGWAVRGTVAYGATRAVGEAALARLSAGHDLIEGAPIDKARPVIDRVVGRLRR
jgi:uncharacterized protein (DUF697 family)